MLDIDFDAAALYEALPRRISVRNYEKRSLTQEDLDLIIKKIEKVNALFPQIKIYLIEQGNKDVFKGILGSYGKINNAPNYFVLTADEGFEKAEGILGYVGEYLVAECTAKHLGTCWAAGTFKKSEVMKDIPLKPNEKIFSLIAVGYHDSSKMDLIKKIAPSKRKSIEKIVNNLEDYSKAPAYLKECIEFARIAPSAINRQPWQFEIGENNIKVVSDAGNLGKKQEKSKDMDLGIALFHIITVLKYYNKDFKIVLGKNVFAEIAIL